MHGRETRHPWLDLVTINPQGRRHVGIVPQIYSLELSIRLKPTNPAAAVLGLSHLVDIDGYLQRGGDYLRQPVAEGRRQVTFA